MDSKNQDNLLKKYDEKSLDKLQSRTVFNDPAYQFIFKKTEKIVAAIYLVTNLISDTDPIKWQIRKSAIGLMSDTSALKRSATIQSRQMILDLMTNISEIMSLLKIASISDHVSTMNYSIIQREISILMNSLDALNSESLGHSSVMLSQDFFNIPVPVSAPVNHVNNNLIKNSGTGGFYSKGHYRTQTDVKDTQNDSVQKDNIKDNRRENMIKLLKVGKPLGIKDFVKEIKGYSEKTLQRELLAMVESGVLKKTGERRWSTYSLA